MDSWCYFSEKSAFSSSGSERKISDEKVLYNPATAFSQNYESGPKRSDSSVIIDLKLGRTSERSIGDSLNRKRTPFCQVYGCKKDLSSSKEYHKRHKVCDIHSKTAKVIVNGIEQRFCQQCSRFHILSEFDNGKRSCRKRLAGHNERRRKPRLGISNFKDYYGSRFQDTNTSTLSVSWENRLHSSKLMLQQKNEPVYYSPQRSNHAAILNNSLTRSKIDEINEFPNQDGVIMFSDIGSSSSNFQQSNSSCVLSLLSSLSQDSPKSSHSSWMNNNTTSLHYGDHNPVNIQSTDCMVTAISCHLAGGDPNASFLR